MVGPGDACDTGTLELIIIRHGEPVVEAGIVDPPLTPLGHRQAKATAHHLAEATLDAIVVSPQRRALETVQPLAEHHGMDPVTDARIAEYDYDTGAYVPAWMSDDLTREEITAKFMEDMGPEFDARVKAGFDDIIADNPGRTVAVVCHAGVIGSFLRDVLDTTAWTQAYHASITRVAANRKGTRSLLTFNEHNWIPSE